MFLYSGVFFLLLLTMILVSLAVFIIAESSPGNIAKNVLGAFITPEQEAAFIRQNGLDQPMYVRYLHWIAGNDWVAEKKNRHASEKNYDGRRI